MSSARTTDARQKHRRRSARGASGGDVARSAIRYCFGADAGPVAGAGGGTGVTLAAAGAAFALGAPGVAPRTMFCGVDLPEAGSGYFAMYSGFSTK
jgi:hypothetical protein